jgi:histidinol phosphatase-like enzyme
VLFRHRRELEPPETGEGFSRIDVEPFRRSPRPGLDGRGLLLWYDGIVWTSRAGARTPRSPEDVAVAPGWREVVRRHRAEGWIVLGLSWQPEVARGMMTAADVEAVFARAHEALGAALDHAWCPHGDGPPVCWCRKPLPGLGVLLLERHRLDPARSVFVGRDAPDRAFARALGLAFRDADAMLGEV